MASTRLAATDGTCGRTFAEPTLLRHARAMRPLLRPGSHPLTRTDGSVQLGLDPAAAVVVDDSPDLRAALLGRDLAVTTSRPAARAEAGAAAVTDVVAALADAGAVVDERHVLPLLGTARPGTLAPTAAAALTLAAGDRATAVAATRASHRVEVLTFGDDAPGLDSAHAYDVLTASGVQVRTGPVDPRSRRRHGRTPLGLLVGVGEPPRELVDPWLRAGVPHLIVRVSEGRVLVGPFAEPGSTACLRCIDAHHADVDADWPLLVRQHAVASARPRPDGVPEPVDPCVAAVALAWACRDLVTRADGRRPTSRSAVLTFDAELGAVSTTPWSRHPECACSWTA